MQRYSNIPDETIHGIHWTQDDHTSNTVTSGFNQFTVAADSFILLQRLWALQLKIFQNSILGTCEAS